MPIPLKEGIGGEREGDFTDYFNEKPKYKRFDDFYSRHILDSWVLCFFSLKWEEDMEPCALNAVFQNFILRFNKISLLCLYHWKRGIGGEREGDFMDYFNEKPNIKDLMIFIPDIF